MISIKTDIWVYAHWVGMNEPKCIGILSAQHAKGKKTFNFEYDPAWIQSKKQFVLDPDILWYVGAQYPNGKENFGVFHDSMPDTWGRTLMKRRAAQLAKKEKKPQQNLYDIDFLLGVNDFCKSGALRFKLDPNGPFLNNDNTTPVPPWVSLGELQYAVNLIESDKENDEVRKWLSVLLAPGSSLGGARPKANVVDKKGNIWIAKFPSKNDTTDKAVWEYLAYKLSINAGIDMAESKIEKVAGKYHTFFTKRFDCEKKERIHFASAMTMTGNNEEILKSKTASYLDIADFIQFSGIDIEKNLHQLWRRIVFNIAISNTDDHLRNHGFLLHNKGWELSPAFDINPSVDKDGLSLNIDNVSNELDFELAKSVGEFFQLRNSQMEEILSSVKKSVSNWKKIADEIGIPRKEQELMRSAFRS